MFTTSPIQKLLSRFFLVFALCTLLAACGPSKDDLDEFMEQTREKPGGVLDPLPQFVPAEPFAYSASGLRSPFQQPRGAEDVGDGKEAQAPDTSRPKEVLENFNIDQLSMVGTLQGADQKLWVLVSDGAGGVHRVSEGNYIGRNYGRILKVYPDKIEVLEVVPNGRGGWLERPKTIVIKER